MSVRYDSISQYTSVDHKFTDHITSILVLIMKELGI